MERRRIDKARRVWRAVSAHPGISRRELMADLGISYGATHSALCLLREMGYITFDPGKSRTIRVRIPFVIAQEQK